MLRLENISYSYPGGTPALRNVTATLPPGMTVLVGPNAGGKTTLLRVLAGLFPPSSGTIGDGDGNRHDPAHLRRTGRMLMQDADMQILGGTVGEDVMLGQANAVQTAVAAGENPAAAAAAWKDQAEDLARHFQLDTSWRHPVASLSYGQKRKLCLLHALLAKPSRLLLDEPFAGLDYPSALELRHILRHNARAGISQIISTHEIEPLYDAAQWLIVIRGGEVVATGTPRDLAGRLETWSVRSPGTAWPDCSGEE